MSWGSLQETAQSEYLQGLYEERPNFWSQLSFYATGGFDALIYTTSSSQYL